MEGNSGGGGRTMAASQAKRLPRIALFLASSGQGARTFGQGHGAGTHAIEDGAGPLAVDFDGDGTLQQADGDYQAINLVRVANNAFHACQRAALDVHLGADAEEGPGLHYQPGTKARPDGLDLFVVNGDGGLAGADDTDHAGRGQDGHQAITHVKPAEQIAGEEWEIQFLDPVGPPPPGAIERQKFFIALAAQGGGGDASQS